MAHVVAIVLSEPIAEENLSSWLVKDVLRQGLRESFHDVLYRSVQIGDEAGGSSNISGTSSSGTSSGFFLDAAQDMIQTYVDTHSSKTESDDYFVFLICAVFWDGQSEVSKSVFAQLRHLSEEKSEVRKQWSSMNSNIEVLVQALNAKKGTHTMGSNRVALIQSLQKKTRSSAILASQGQLPLHSTNNSSSNGASKEGETAEAAAAPAAAAASSIGEKDISVSAVLAAVEESQGECFFVIGAPTRSEFDERVAELKRNCEEAEVGCAAVLPEPREVQVAAASAQPVEKTTVLAQEFLLRRDSPGTHLEMRMAMCGNVDSGKSTLTSVLTRGCRDDGRGFARAFVFNHKHEAATGRTSSISENHLGFSAVGDVVNYTQAPSGASTAASAEKQSAAPESGSGSDSNAQLRSAIAAATARQYTPQELASRSAKVFTLYDLAGHERYLKTTVLGMTRNMPDYACIVISANNGIQRMTKEHLALCLALKLPFFIVVTRIDAVPENVHKETMASIHKLLKIPTVRKLPYPVRRPDEVVLAAKNLRSDRIAPIFELSNVTGEGVPDLLRFLNLLPMRQDWRLARTLPKEMVIDSTFFVTGVGTVVGGIVTQGVFHVNDTVLLGPDGLGVYRPVSIKSIHIKGIDSECVEAGNDAAFCLKKEKRSAIRKGSILAAQIPPPVAYWRFEAEITILYHSTTITTNYEPVIHSTTVRQSARITHVARDVLRTGDKSEVHFHFLYRPEFMKIGQRLIFREGRTKGIGVVTKLVVEADDSLLAKHKKIKRAQALFIFHHYERVRGE